jgi:hypothetical protein
MTTQRSNVGPYSNVSVRIPSCDASKDESFRRSVRTREAILALNPWIKTAAGIDWAVARAELTPAQLDVLENHFACPVCGRWDRWPVFTEMGWALSRTQFDCLCSHARESERTDMSRVQGPADELAQAGPGAAAPEQAAQRAKRRGRGDLRGGLG